MNFNSATKITIQSYIYVWLACQDIPTYWYLLLEHWHIALHINIVTKFDQWHVTFHVYICDDAQDRCAGMLRHQHNLTFNLKLFINNKRHWRTLESALKLYSTYLFNWVIQLCRIENIPSRRLFVLKKETKNSFLKFHQNIICHQTFLSSLSEY